MIKEVMLTIMRENSWNSCTPWTLECGSRI